MDLSNKLLDLNLKYNHPLGGYSPKELGIEEPGINRIFLDDCGGDKPLHYTHVSWWSAHTHACQLDPLYKSICLLKKYLRNSDGTLSDIFWHEYGHVIVKRDVLLKHTKLSGAYVHEWEDNKNLHVVEAEFYSGKVGESLYQDAAHGKAWEDAMRRIGKAHLISRLAEPPR